MHNHDSNKDLERFCYCCHQNKRKKDFWVHAKSKELSDFCIDCHNEFSSKHRKNEQFKFIYNILQQK